MRSLHESTGLLAELEADIAAGQARADDLQRQIEENQALAALTADQRRSVDNLVAEQLGKSERRTFRAQFWLAFVFFLLGVAASAIAAAIAG